MSQVRLKRRRLAKQSKKILRAYPKENKRCHQCMMTSVPSRGRQKKQISLDDVYKMGPSVYFCGFLAFLLENPYFPSNETRAQALERFWKFATGIAAVLQNHKAEIARHLNVVKATKAMLTQPKAWDCLLQLGLAMSMDSCLSTVAFCRRVLLLR